MVNRRWTQVLRSGMRTWGGIAGLLILLLSLAAVYLTTRASRTDAAAPAAPVNGAQVPGSLRTAATGSRQSDDPCPASTVRVQKGLAVLWRPPTATASGAELARHIATYARSLGANSLSVNFLVSVDGLTGNRVYAGPETPNMASLRQILAAAKAKHLRVALRPLIDETNIPRPQWRGTLRPSSPTQWFSSYGTLVGTYARLAKATCSDELVVGAELNSLQKNAAGWARVLADVRAAGYRGEISYAANWDAPKTLAFTPGSGVDFYPKLPLRPSASTAQLTGAMVAAFHKMPASFLASLVVQETGLSAYGGKFSFPSLWNPGSAPTFDQQAMWFTAACDAARTVKAQGLYYWGLDSYTDPLLPDQSTLGTFAFVTRPAADAVRRCFTQAW